MTEKNTHLAAPNVVSICIDSYGRGDGSGRLYNKYEREPYLFSNVIELFNRMEWFYDWLDFPQAATANRSFKKKKDAESQKKRVQEGQQVLSREEIKKQRGQKATFVVHVQYRQNATWQGQVIWADKQISQNFRSALELMKLMDSAMDRQDEENENIGGGNHEA